MNISILQTEIPRRCNSCQKCLAAFSCGDHYCSVLENTGRHDFCLTCWSQMATPPLRCFWKATIPKKKEIVSPAQIKISSIIKLLKADLDKNPIEALLLALYLVRKRILTFRKDYVEGDQVFGLYEVISTEEMIAVKRVSLFNADLKTIKISIVSKLASFKDWNDGA